MWRNVICRYGVLHALIIYNSKQFDNRNFREFCEKQFELRFYLPTHPKANGQVEAANKIIKRILKTRLREKTSMGRRVIQCVMGLQNPQKIVIGETLFAIAFGHEIVIPAKIRMIMHQTKNFNGGKEERDSGQPNSKPNLKPNWSVVFYSCQITTMKYINQNPNDASHS